MKNIAALFILLLLACSAGAQRIVEKEVHLSPNATVNLNIQIADSIKIITWNKSTAYVKTSINLNDNKDNDRYLVNFEGEGSSFEMKTKIEPKKEDDNSCCCNTRVKVYSEIYVPENIHLSIETINGNITISGNIAIVHAKSISGFVDLAIQPNRKADVKLSTISGTMYSDLDLTPDDKKDVPRVGGTRIAKALNGGGDPIDLQTISGNIYLRKS